MCVCMCVIFIRCDKRTSNNKHKMQSQNDVQYKAAKPKKTISLDKAIQRTDKKRFLMKISRIFWQLDMCLSLNLFVIIF